jgi:hypothetical protein
MEPPAVGLAAFGGTAPGKSAEYGFKSEGLSLENQSLPVENA